MGKTITVTSPLLPPLEELNTYLRIYGIVNGLRTMGIIIKN